MIGARARCRHWWRALLAFAREGQRLLGARSAMATPCRPTDSLAWFIMVKHAGHAAVLLADEEAGGAAVVAIDHGAGGGGMNAELGAPIEMRTRVVALARRASAWAGISAPGKSEMPLVPGGASATAASTR